MTVGVFCLFCLRALHTCLFLQKNLWIPSVSYSQLVWLVITLVFLHGIHRMNSAKKLFPKGSFRVSYKRGHKILKEFLALSRVAFENTDTLSHSKRQHHGKCAKCGSCGKSTKARKRSSGFYCCQVLEENNQFKSFQTKEQYRIKQDINCKSENVIYLVTCKRCGLQEVGSCSVLS